MRAFLPAGLLRRLAVVLHRLARALERLAPPRADAAAMGDLSALFPGAPEHWLGYIASRAPHLAAPRSAQARAATPADEPVRPSAPQAVAEPPPLALPHPPRGRHAPLRLLPRVTVPEASPPPGSDPAPAPSRARLRLLPPGPDPVAPTAPQSRDADEAPPRAPLPRDPGETSHPSGPIALAARTPSRTAPVHRVAADEPLGKAASGPAWARIPRLRPESLRTWLTAAMRKARAIALAWPVAEAASHSVHPWKTQQPDTPRHKTDPAWPGSAGPGKSAAALAFAGPPLSPSSPASRRHEDRRAAWPALPPPEETAPGAPVPPPRIGRLRREQEEGLWSA